MKRVPVLAALALSGCQWIPGTDASKIAQAENDIRAGAIDPASVDFRGVWLNPNNQVVCGEFNGKNRMGGFDGFAPFYHIEGATFIGDQNASPKEQLLFAEGMRATCGDNPNSGEH